MRIDGLSPANPAGNRTVGIDVERSAVGRRPRSGWQRLVRDLLLVGLILVALWGSTDRADAAAVKAKIKRDVLTVTGTAGAYAIGLRLKAGAPNMLEVDVGADGTAEFTFDRGRFAAIVVNGGAGQDILVADRSSGSFTGAEATTLDGGDGNDTVIGEHGDPGAGALIVLNLVPQKRTTAACQRSHRARPSGHGFGGLTT